jgi:hypothetical protein
MSAGAAFERAIGGDRRSLSRFFAQHFRGRERL